MLAVQSHPPLHRPAFSGRVKVPADARFVDPEAGDDEGSGERHSPWRTINFALEQLRPGDTLMLRGGVYFEHVYCSIVGTPEAQITIRGFPGEVAIIDGSLPEFQQRPEEAWVPGEAPGEYISREPYRNIRDVLGLFEDSHLGLQTYWQLDYLLAENELAGRNPATGKLEPYYCGPGLFYDKATGHIHVRLTHTRHSSPSVSNYEGETDPRELPLVIAPFRASPLYLDQAMHLRFQDLVLRGGGYNTLLMHFAVDVEFEYVTIYGGSYCIRSKNSGPIRLKHCGVYGQIPPWAFRDENCLSVFTSLNHLYYDPFTRPDPPFEEKNIARLPTHALLVTEGGEESDIFCFPSNNRWEISYCEFADSHDGLYFNGHQMWLHHCWVHHLQDDVFYLSNPTPTNVCDDIHISENYLSHCMLPFGAHRRGCATGDIYVYSNVVDMRVPVQFYRPSFEQPEGRMQTPNQIGTFFLAHGRQIPQAMENIGFFHNTALVTSRYVGDAAKPVAPETTRSIYNNLFVYYNGWPDLPMDLEPNGRVEIDGNLHWSPTSPQSEEAGWLERAQGHPASGKNVSTWGGSPWEQGSLVGDPAFYQFDHMEARGNDFRLLPGSPARNAAVDFPQKARLKGSGVGPHIGALQSDAPLRVGINGRITAGE